MTRRPKLCLALAALLVAATAGCGSGVELTPQERALAEREFSRYSESDHRLLCSQIFSGNRGYDSPIGPVGSRRDGFKEELARNNPDWTADEALAAANRVIEGMAERCGKRSPY